VVEAGAVHDSCRRASPRRAFSFPPTPRAGPEASAATSRRRRAAPTNFPMARSTVSCARPASVTAAGEVIDTARARRRSRPGSRRAWPRSAARSSPTSRRPRASSPPAPGARSRAATTSSPSRDRRPGAAVRRAPLRERRHASARSSRRGCRGGRARRAPPSCSLRLDEGGLRRRPAIVASGVSALELSGDRPSPSSAGGTTTSLPRRRAAARRTRGRGGAGRLAVPRRPRPAGSGLAGRDDSPTGASGDEVWRLRKGDPACPAGDRGRPRPLRS
jgi:hypothetical protein